MSFWWNFPYWLHRKFSKWQLPMQPVTNISSKRHFRFCDVCVFLCLGLYDFVPLQPRSMWSRWYEISNGTGSVGELRGAQYEQHRCRRLALCGYQRWVYGYQCMKRILLKIEAGIKWALFRRRQWMKMYERRLKFHWSLFLRAQLTIFQHSFR